MELNDLPNPIRYDGDGVARVGASRVPIDTVIIAFHDGATPEEIVQQYPALTLPDVYALIAYYLSHRDTVDAYLAERRANSDRVRRENEARHDPTGIRERLLARKRMAS